MYCEQRSQYIRIESKKNSFRGNYSRKYGMSEISRGLYCSGAGTGGATALAPQYLSDHLTLFEPGRADYSHLLLLAPPKFFTFRQHCTAERFSLEETFQRLIFKIGFNSKEGYNGVFRVYTQACIYHTCAITTRSRFVTTLIYKLSFIFLFLPYSFITRWID